MEDGRGRGPELDRHDAVVQYIYQIARENHKKEREMVTGNYTDVLIKENGRWQFLTWSGGDQPKK